MSWKSTNKTTGHQIRQKNKTICKIDGDKKMKKKAK